MPTTQTSNVVSQTCLKEMLLLLVSVIKCVRCFISSKSNKIPEAKLNFVLILIQ